VRSSRVAAALSPLPSLLKLARQASYRWDEFLVRQLRGPHELRSGRPAVLGFLRSSIGLGALGRLNARALEHLGLDPSWIDVGPVFNLAPAVGPPLPIHPDCGEGPVWLHVNPPELPRALRTVGVNPLRHRWLIGYWNWELSEIDSLWCRSFSFVDEIWVPSRFTASAFDVRSSPPTRVVHPPLPPPRPPSAGREVFGLPEDVVVFLMAFDMRSSMDRKNPLGAIRAFRRAMGDRTDALLVVKVSHAAEDSRQFAVLEREVAGMPNVRIMSSVISELAMSELLHACDVVVSLHRAEGFGLLLAEAMQRGRCVVATDWSGNCDFLNDENSLPVPYVLRPVRDAQGIYRNTGRRVWAEPNLDAAADRIRSLVARPDLRKELGARAKNDAERLFSLPRFVEAAGPSLTTCLEAISAP